MPRTLAADFLAAMESGNFTPYFNLQLVDVDRTSVMFETEDVLGFELDGLKATVTFHDPGYFQDFYMFRIQRGVIISGTPHYVTSSSFWPTKDRHEKRIRTLEGHIFPNEYYSTDGDHTYHEVIDDVCAYFGVGVTFEDPAAAWLNYQFLPAGKSLILNNARYFFSFLRQKYLIFATDYDDNNLFFYQAKNTAPAYPAGYTSISARQIAAPGNGALKSRYFVSIDESGVAHTSGTATNPIHHLGYLHSTASHPDRRWFVDTTDWVVQGIPPNLKYLDFDAIIIEYDVVDQTVWPARFREIFNRKLSPTWQWQMRNLDIFGDTEGGALPADIQTSSPYMPLNTSGFNGILDENDTNLQAAMNTIDGHGHTFVGGSTDHGALSGRGDDDHTQYHNDARGDARYQLLDSDLTSIALLGTAANKMLYTTNAHTWAEADLTAAGRALLDDANAAAQLATLGAMSNADGTVTYAKMQHVSATDKLLGRSSAGAGDVEEIACTAAGRALLDDANAAAQLATLGAAASGHDHAATYQPLDADLTSIALLGTAANKMLYTTNAHTWAEEIACTAAGRALLDDANAAAQLATLGAAASGHDHAATYQPLDADLTSIALLGTAANKMIYTTAANTWAEADLTAAGRSLLDDANAAAQIATLGLGTAALAATGDFEAAGAIAIHAALLTGIHGLAITAAKTLTVTDSATIANASITLANTGSLTLPAAATTISGGGTLALGGFTGTVPATATFAMGAGTLTSATANDVTGATHTHAITASTALVAAGSSQYQVLATAANPYPATWSGFLLDGTTGGKTIFAVTNTKTLTLTSTGDFNLTVPATGTAALLATANVFTTQQMVDGTSDQIQLRVQGHSTQTTHLQTWENSAAAEQITFECPVQNTATLGVELITNGNFDTNLSGWTTYGPIATVAVNAPGNGYNVGDVLTVVQTGGALGTLTVATLTGGAGSGVATVTLLAAGTGYTAATGLATTVAPAGGTNCTIDILTITGWAWNASANATRAVVAGTGAITQSINLTNGTTYQVTVTIVRTAGTLTETFGSMVGSYGFTSSQTVSRTFKATATAAFILTFTPSATFGGSIDSVSVRAITAGITANASFNNTDGTYGMELRAGGTGLNNTYMGYQAGYYNTTGYNNIALGYGALYSNTTGYNNIAYGMQSLFSNTTGYGNFAQGVQALYSNTIGYNNVALGYQALYSNTTGYNNSAEGMGALQYNTSGIYNSAQGSYALRYNTTGNYNSAQGYAALFNNTTGIDNTAQGYHALYNNTTGNTNSAQGNYALWSNTTGYYNTAIGYYSLYNLRPTSSAITSFANYGATVAGTVKATSVGHGLTGTTTKRISGTVNYNGLKSVTVIDVDNFYFTATWVATETGWWSIDSEGRYNTGIGSNAGSTLTTADSCTFIGYNAGYNASQLATATNSTAIGYGTYTAASNQIVLGNTSVTTFGIGTYNPTAHVQFTGVSDLIGLRILGNATQTTSVLSLETSAASVNISMDNSGGAIFNEQGNAAGDFRVESDNYDALFIDASANSIEIMHNAAGLIGFYGITPVAQQTGVSVTAAGIHAALVALGLITA